MLPQIQTKTLGLQCTLYVLLCSPFTAARRRCGRMMTMSKADSVSSQIRRYESAFVLCFFFDIHQ